MLLKVLDDCRVKIMVESVDIQKYEMPYEKIDYEDPSSRAFIYELICYIKEHTGLDFTSNKLMVEVIPGCSRVYYILITKLERCEETDIEFDKTALDEREVYVFRLLKLSETMNFIKKKTDRLNVLVYRYGRDYYLVIMASPQLARKDFFENFLIQMDEYAGRCRYNYMNEAILNEYGELVSDYTMEKE